MSDQFFSGYAKCFYGHTLQDRIDEIRAELLQNISERIIILIHSRWKLITKINFLEDVRHDIAAVTPYFQEGEESELKAQLDDIVETFQSIYDEIHANEAPTKIQRTW